MSARSMVKQTGDWRLYEEAFERWNIYLDFPKNALEATESGLRLTIPADVWEVLRSTGHSFAPCYQLAPEQIRELAQQWVDDRICAYLAAEDDAEKARVSLQGCAVTALDQPRDAQIEEIVRFYTPPNPPATEEYPEEELEKDPDFEYSIYPDINKGNEGITEMGRGSYCYFCGSQLVSTASDEEGGCYECPKCPPMTHWRWNDDTEFLQLYVPGEKCPYCEKHITSVKQAEVKPGGVKSAGVKPAERPQRMETVIEAAPGKKPGKPVTVDGVWWASVVEWCRANNGHDVRKHHNCSKELARMQTKGEAVVEWHNRDHIPGTRELIGSGQA